MRRTITEETEDHLRYLNYRWKEFTALRRKLDDVRATTATKKDLEARSKKTFRDDLYYPLKLVYIQTRSLRDVSERHSSGGEAFCRAINKEPKQVTGKTLNCGRATAARQRAAIG
jgi:DNA-binding NtrC family response regulator